MIAASAGGLEGILKVLAPLPADFPAAIALVQHRTGDSQLVEVLSARTRLRVVHARTGMAIEAGTVYVCPPGVHMTAEHALRLTEGAHIDFVRPSGDLMFDSVARTFGERAIGVVLSGCGYDAALGSLAIAHAGGTVLAQDRRTCAFDGMPARAIELGGVHAEMTPAEIALELERIVHGRCAFKRSLGGGSKVEVILADDHRIVLEGLRVLLESESDLDVVATGDDGVTVRDAALRLRPDVVVMDIRMPGLDGIECTRQILAAAPDVRIVALSAEHDTASVELMLRAGAVGYLTKQRAFTELVSAIRTVMDGKPYLSPEVARLVTTGRVAPPRVPPRAY